MKKIYLVFGIIFLVIMYIDFVYVLEIWISLDIKEKKLNVFNNWKKSIWRFCNRYNYRYIFFYKDKVNKIC